MFIKKCFAVQPILELDVPLRWVGHTACKSGLSAGLLKTEEHRCTLPRFASYYGFSTAPVRLENAHVGVGCSARLSLLIPLPPCSAAILFAVPCLLPLPFAVPQGFQAAHGLGCTLCCCLLAFVCFRLALKFRGSNAPPVPPVTASSAQQVLFCPSVTLAPSPHPPTHPPTPTHTQRHPDYRR